jgi:hypothetical protein
MCSSTELLRTNFNCMTKPLNIKLAAFAGFLFHFGCSENSVHTYSFIDKILCCYHRCKSVFGDPDVILTQCIIREGTSTTQIAAARTARSQHIIVDTVHLIA